MKLFRKEIPGLHGASRSCPTQRADSIFHWLVRCPMTEGSHAACVKYNKKFTSTFLCQSSIWEYASIKTNRTYRNSSHFDTASQVAHLQGRSSCPVSYVSKVSELDQKGHPFPEHAFPEALCSVPPHQTMFPRENQVATCDIYYSLDN